MDHRRLLVKYIRHVWSCEGTAFITPDVHHGESGFSPEEADELAALEAEALEDEP